MQTPPPEEDMEGDVDNDRPAPLLMQGPKSDRYVDDEYVEHQSTMSKLITRSNFHSPTSSLVGGANPTLSFIKDLSNEMAKENIRTAFLASAIKIQQVKSPGLKNFQLPYLDRLNDKSNISANEAIKFKNEAVRMSLDSTIEQSDLNIGSSFRAKNNLTDLKIAVDNIKIAPSVNFSQVT